MRSVQRKRANAQTGSADFHTADFPQVLQSQG